MQGAKTESIIVHALAGCLALCLAFFVDAGCDARYPACRSNSDCVGRAVNGALGPVCANLRCVQCQYDADCDGGTCNGNAECERLAVPEGRSATSEPHSKTHASWDECAAECKDPECIKACEDKFGPHP